MRSLRGDNTCGMIIIFFFKNHFFCLLICFLTEVNSATLKSSLLALCSYHTRQCSGDQLQCQDWTGLTVCKTNNLSLYLLHYPESFLKFHSLNGLLAETLGLCQSHSWVASLHTSVVLEDPLGPSTPSHSATHKAQFLSFMTNRINKLNDGLSSPVPEKLDVSQFHNSDRLIGGWRIRWGPCTEVHYFCSIGKYNFIKIYTIIKDVMKPLLDIKVFRKIYS